MNAESFVTSYIVLLERSMKFRFQNIGNKLVRLWHNQLIPLSLKKTLGTLIGMMVWVKEFLHHL